MFDTKADRALRRNHKVLEVLNTPHGSRPPDPSTYLSAEYISKHLSKFDEGSSRIVTKSDFYTYGVGKPDPGKTEFVFPKSEMDKILRLSNAEIAKKLGVPESQLKGNLIRIDFKPTNKIEMPTGNEFGANNNRWIPGGKTSGGISEAIIKTDGMKQGIDFTVNDL